MLKQKFFLTVCALYQLFSALLISLGAWPQQIVFINLLLSLFAIMFFDDEYGLYSVILTIPFYLVIPNRGSDTLASWRPVFLFLFLVYVLRNRPKGGVFKKLTYFRWDRTFAWFLAAALLSLVVAASPGAGLKKIIFIVNIYFLYVVALNVIRNREQVVRALTATFVSLAAIVLLGFVQYASTFATSTYYFWQYWALFISKAYYGTGLATTLTYSNSWFSFYKNQAPSLRMFSVLPDSHAFSVVAMFSIPFAATLLWYARRRWQRIPLWSFIVLAALGITMSGTRGVWAAIVAPIAVLAFLNIKGIARGVARRTWIPLLLVIILLVASPIVQKVAGKIGKHNYGNFIDRAETITQFDDPSNVGRLHMWKQTLQFWVNHPILGVGFGNFQISLSQSDAKAYNLPLKYITAHDLYLDMLAETGIIGLMVFANYVGVILKRFWDFVKEQRSRLSDGQVFFVASCGLYLVWLFAYSIVDGALLNDRVLMYYFLMLALSARIMLLAKEDKPEANAEAVR